MNRGALAARTRQHDTAVVSPSKNAMADDTGNRIAGEFLRVGRTRGESDDVAVIRENESDQSTTESDTCCAYQIFGSERAQ